MRSRSQKARRLSPAARRPRCPAAPPALQVFVNGVWVGVHRDPVYLVTTIRELRRKMDVNTEARSDAR